jgi:hypothetical protein
MKQAKTKDDDMRAEYRREDLGSLVRGKYAAQYALKRTSPIIHGHLQPKSAQTAIHKRPFKIQRAI